MRLPTPSVNGPVSVDRDKAEPRLRLNLLDHFELWRDGHVVPAATAIQRLLAFLALRRRPVGRLLAAGTLWLDSSERRASGSLRSALWRLKSEGLDLVEATPTQVGLAPTVTVDLDEATTFARALTDRSATALQEPLQAGPLTKDVLPDWYDDWVLIERERYRHIRLHALEALCERLTQEGRFALAIEIGLAAVTTEPLRESAHRVLIGAHLAEGNVSEAIRQARTLRDLLRTELGVDPPEDLAALVRA